MEKRPEQMVNNSDGKAKISNIKEKTAQPDKETNDLNPKEADQKRPTLQNPWSQKIQQGF